MNFVQEQYEKKTKEKATYRKDSCDYHTLKYVRWLEKKLLEKDLNNGISKRNKRFIVKKYEIKNNTPNRLRLLAKSFIGDIKRKI